MSKKAEFLEITAHISAGKLEEAYKLLKTQQLTSTNALCFFISCNKACNGKTSPDPTDIFKFMQYLAGLITTVTPNQYENYLHALIFILKHYMDKELFDSFSELQPLLLPSFLPGTLTTKHCSFYESSLKIIYNGLVKIVNSKDVKRVKSAITALELSYLIQDLLTTKKYTKMCLNVLLEFEQLENPEKCRIITDFFKRAKIQKVDEEELNWLLYFYKIKEFQIAAEIQAAFIKNIEQTTDLDLLVEVLDVANWLNPVLEPQEDCPKTSHAALKNYYNKHECGADLIAIADFIVNLVVIVGKTYKSEPECWLKRTERQQSCFFRILGDLAKIQRKSAKNAASLTTLGAILSLTKLSIFNSELSHAFCLAGLKYAEICLGWIAKKPENWEKCWLDVASFMYNSALHWSQQHKNEELTILFFRKIVKLAFEFEGLRPTIFHAKYRQCALQFIAQAYHKKGEFEKALTTVAFNIAAHAGEPNQNAGGAENWSRWIIYKANLRDNPSISLGELHGVTIVSILAKNHTEIAFYTPHFHLSDQTKIELLTAELQSYRSKWKSKLPMKAVFGELLQLAAAETCAEIAIKTWGKNDLQVHDDLHKLLTILVQKCEKEGATDWHLAYSYYLLHFHSMQQLVHANTREIDEMLALQVVRKEADPGEQLPHDECDVISTYDCLRFAKYASTLTSLERSYNLALKLRKTAPETSRELYDLFQLLADEFLLHSDHRKSVTMRCMALSIAKSIGQPALIVEATAFLLELKACKKMVEAVDGLLEMVENDETNRDKVVVFYVCKAEAFFYTDWKLAHDSFSEAKRVAERCDNLSGIWKARIGLMRHKMAELPCKHRIERHREFTASHIHMAQDEAHKHYKTCSDNSSYNISIYIQIHEELARTYSSLRRPRETRGYTANSLIFAQKLLLPLRAAKLLYYLALSDILNCRFDDCRVKIDGLSSMLGARPTRPRPTKLTPRKSPHHLHSHHHQIVDNLAHELCEMVLDVPQAPECVQFFDGSPSFALDLFKMPDFSQHPADCACAICAWVEYQTCHVACYFLEGLLLVHEKKNVKIARDYFSGAVKVYEVVMARPMSAQGWVFLLEVYFSVLKEWANILLRLPGNLESAESLNRKLSKSLLDKQLQGFEHLLNEVKLQKCSIQTLRMAKSGEKARVEVVVDRGSEAKTPESMKSEAPVVVGELGEFSAIRKRPNAAVKAQLFKGEDGGVVTPPKGGFAVYERSGRRTRRKPALADCELKKNLKGEFMEQELPEKVVEVKKDVLGTRSKLLTERLKSSMKKKENVPERPKLGDVRKNLLGNLENGEVRRSKRNK